MQCTDVHLERVMQSQTGVNIVRKSALRILGGSNPPQHNHFMFVETDDMSKLRYLMIPYIEYWDVVITPVMNVE